MLRNRARFMAAILLALLALSAMPAAAQTAKPIEIKFWHAMSGDPRQAAIKTLVDKFNTDNPDIHVTPIFKGAYPDLFNATLLVSRQPSAPDIVQIYEIGSELANDSGVFVPIGDVIDDAGKKLLDDVIPTVSAYYSKGGKYNSVPWNSSNPVLYFNAGVLKAAGLDPAKPPATWADLKTACAAIVAAKAAPNCITFSVYGWYFEQWMALENQTLVNNDNGRTARPTASNLDSAAATDIFTFLKDLNDNKYFTYTGKLEDSAGSSALFTSKQTAFLIDSTAGVSSYQAAADKAGFKMGVGFMPINEKVPRNGNVIGGASLWLVGGHPDAETKAAAKFELYLLTPDAMVIWHKGSGYLPITNAAQKSLSDAKWFDTNPGFKVAVDQLNASQSNNASAGALIGPFQNVRTIIETDWQAMLNGKMTVADALKDAKTQIDKQLNDYSAQFQ